MNWTVEVIFLKMGKFSAKMGEYACIKPLFCPSVGILRQEIAILRIAGSQRILKNGETNYFHSALTPVIVQPGNEHVISLEPDAKRIVPQDGHEKQDCETQAGKRWVEKHGAFYAKRGVSILGDDLYSRQPFCQALKDKHLHFILVCKPDSHANLYETVDFLAAQGVLATKVIRKWIGGY